MLTRHSIASRFVAATCLLAGSAHAQSHVTCVGDSITAGGGTSSAPNAYPAVLQALLGSRYAVENDGHSGATLMRAGDEPYWTTSEFASSTAWAATGGDVVIQLGTNDSKPWNWSKKASFLSDCQALVAHYRSGPGRPRVWVSLVPPASPKACCSIDSSAIAREVVPLLGRCAAETGASTIDVFGALAPRLDWLPDGVHPDDRGAAVIAQTVRDALAKVPTIQLSFDAQRLTEPAHVVLIAAPAAAYGKIEKVVFREGGAVLGEATASPWRLVLDAVPHGTHVYRAEAVETAGRTSAPADVSIEVAAAAAPPGAPPVSSSPSGGQSGVDNRARTASDGARSGAERATRTGCAHRSREGFRGTVVSASAGAAIVLVLLRRRRHGRRSAP